MDLCANGEKLEIRGSTDRTMDLACDVGMPMPVALDQIETDYANEALFVTVLPPAGPARPSTSMPGGRLTAAPATKPSPRRN